ncbi:hypothetical protein ACPA54_04865 [Uniformispora flossi]|uniref:hypothetical protein n=1 Tax=Uniformispora flossi TaxID=3390723 RepID=UPI003C2CBECA
MITLVARSFGSGPAEVLGGEGLVAGDDGPHAFLVPGERRPVAAARGLRPRLRRLLALGLKPLPDGIALMIEA